MTDRDQRFSENIPTPPFQQASVPETPQQPKEKMVARMKRKIGKLHLFASFCESPSNVTFQTQDADEHVLLFLRKSQWVNAPWIIATAVLLLVPVVIFFFQGSFTMFLPSLKVTLILLPLYYLFVAIYAFVNFMTWYYNVALITDKRVIDVDFHQVVLKDVAETKLTLVQDVSYNQDGVFPNIFGYGFVLIQTAGTLDNFEFHNLPQPARVVEVVESLIGRQRTYEP